MIGINSIPTIFSKQEKIELTIV